MDGKTLFYNFILKLVPTSFLTGRGVLSRYTNGTDLRGEPRSRRLPRRSRCILYGRNNRPHHPCVKRVVTQGCIRTVQS